MTKNKLCLLLGMLFLSITCALQAEDQAAAPTSQPAVISAGDEAALDAAVGKEATVEGTVSTAKWTASGKVFLITFEEAATTSFQGAIFAKGKAAMEKALDGDLTKALQGAKIHIHGTVKTFKEHPEIAIDQPDQIVIIEKPTTQPSAQTAE